MFKEKDFEKRNILMKAMDKINNALGKETVRMATQDFKKRYKLRTDHLSPRYIKDIAQILKVNR